MIYVLAQGNDLYGPITAVLIGVMGSGGLITIIRWPRDRTSSMVVDFEKLRSSYGGQIDDLEQTNARLIRERDALLIEAERKAARIRELEALLGEHPGRRG